MGIKVLSQEVAAKIAAGEVVERPVSVVKELIENSIDANATEITVRIEDAGKQMIEVADNGSGIPAGETAVALKRYATSKLRAISDLDTIKTLGFRGEALASIAAVSLFTIASRIAESDVGIYSKIEGGREVSKKPIGRPPGTQILVENLFFNVPARLKFLKSDRTETRLIKDLIIRYALYYADIRFSLLFEDKNVFQSRGNGSRREILSSIYDLETAKALLEVEASSAGVSVEGFTSPLTISRASRREIVFFVNGRLISNSTLSAAVTRAYHGLLMVGRYPIAALFIQISSSDIDVNVHPTKAEIRLKNPDAVFSFIHSSVRKTISAFAPFAVIPPVIWSSQDRTPTMNFPDQNFIDGGDEDGEDTPYPNQGGFYQQRENEMPLLRLIGQLGTTYIAAEGPDGLYLIDQHAAHERVLYEKISASPRAENNAQMLLEPVILNLSNLENEALIENEEFLAHLGFRIEPFGQKDYKLTAIPSVLSGNDPRETLLGALNDDNSLPGHSNVDAAEDEQIISRICKRLAVKGGQTLTHAEQLQLVRDLESCENPRTCPHGRPTMIHISVDALERRFGRKGSV